MTFPRDNHGNSDNFDDSQPDNYYDHNSENQYGNTAPFDPYRQQLPSGYDAHNNYGNYQGKPGMWNYGPAAHTGFSGMPSHNTPMHRPDNFLVLNIIALCLCCLPGGLIGLYFSAKVNSYWDTGQWDEAHRSARNARTWFWISLATPFVLVGLLLLFLFVAVLVGVDYSVNDYGTFLENDVLST